jgi:hypothetical protein
MVRYDLDGDDCINFKEFQLAIIPSQSVQEMEEQNIVYQGHLKKLQTPVKKLHPFIMQENHEKYNTEKLRVNDYSKLQNQQSRMSSGAEARETPMMIRGLTREFVTASPKKVVDVTTLFQDHDMSTAYTRGAAFTTLKKSQNN